MERFKKLAVDHYRYFKISKNKAYLKQAKASLKEYKFFKFYSPV